MQYVNGRKLDTGSGQMNTVVTMRNPAQEIAAALDAAMQTMIVGGKPISQSELSRRSGVPQATISRTLSGKSIPEVETLSPLIAVLGEENVHIPKEVMMLVPHKPLSEQDRTDAFLLHKIGAMEALLHILVSKDEETFSYAQRMFNLYSESTIVSGLNSSSYREDEAAVRENALESTKSAVFWTPDSN